MPGRRLAAGTLVCLMAAPLSSRAQPAPPSNAASPRPWRVILGPSLVDSSLATTYVSRYSPPFPYTSHTSDAIQVMPLDSGRGPGTHLALERTLGRRFALQLSADYGAADISGDPGHYALTMRYTSRPPPFYDPIEVVQQRSLAWPPAEGRLKSLLLSLDFSTWLRLGSRARLGVAAGPAWLRSSGRAQSLVYTAYRMGGHSTSFAEDLLVSFAFSSHTLGIDAGAFVEADLGSRVALRLDARYAWAPEGDADVKVENVVNAEAVINDIDPAEIARGLLPAPVRLDPSLLRISLALVVHF